MHASQINAPEGFHKYTWMDGGHCRAALQPDCLLREKLPQKHHTREDRKTNTIRLRKFVDRFRMENLTAEGATTMINSNVRGSWVRGGATVTSWLDGTFQLASAIVSYNEVQRHELTELLLANGVDPRVALHAPNQPTPTEDSSPASLEAYNNEALGLAKGLMKYPCIRARPMAIYIVGPAQTATQTGRIPGASQ